MKPTRWVAPVVAVLLLTAWSAVGVTTTSASDTVPQQNVSFSRRPERETCPKDCELLFTKLEDRPHGGNGRNKIQTVEVQVRGEPKSGTGMMAEWAWGALAHACIYLQRLYGKSSCRIVWEMDQEYPSSPHNPHKIIFEPRLAAEDDSAPCSCSTVDR